MFRNMFGIVKRKAGLTSGQYLRLSTLFQYSNKDIFIPGRGGGGGGGLPYKEGEGARLTL